MDDLYIGMPVEGANGRIGVVENVLRDGVDEAARLLVRWDSGEMFELAPGMYSVESGVVRLNQDADYNRTGGDGSSDELAAPGSKGSASSTLAAAETGGTPYAMSITPGEEVRIPVLREEAVVRTREVEGGGVRVHKTVTEREEVVQQPLYHEQVDVERVTIGRVVDVMPEVREEGDTLIIPVLEEVLVVEKRLVLKEELRITKRRRQETEEARVALREEQVRVERVDEPRTSM